MKHSFINWIWIDFRAPKFEKTPKASSKGLSVSVHWKLEFWRIVLHNSISKLQETHNFRKTSVMKPPARVNIWYLSLNLIIFSNWNRKKGCAWRFLPKQHFLWLFKSQQTLVALEDFESSFLVAISRAAPDLHHGRDRVTSPTRSSIQVTLRLNVWGDACGGYGGGEVIQFIGQHETKAAWLDPFFFKTIVWNPTAIQNKPSFPVKTKGLFLFQVCTHTCIYMIIMICVYM